MTRVGGGKEINNVHLVSSQVATKNPQRDAYRRSLLYLQYGLMKVFGFPVPGPASLSPLLMLAAAIETIGGLLLLIGLFTEAAAFITCGEMAVAFFLRYVRSALPDCHPGGQSDGAVLLCLFLPDLRWRRLLDLSILRRLKS